MKKLLLLMFVLILVIGCDPLTPEEPLNDDDEPDMPRVRGIDIDYQVIETKDNKKPLVSIPIVNIVDTPL